MKNLPRALIALILAILTATVIPVQVFAGSTDEKYISQVQIGVGKNSAEAEKALEGYEILKDDSGNYVDLNKNAGTTNIGGKGNRVVYMGFKRTADSKEAITDLAVMNMKGGYSVEDYEALMESQMKEQIIPFVESFLVAVKEYRDNYNSSYSSNKHRANYIHDALNKLTDDDCGGAGLGDLLLNETKYEMGDAAYNQLSDNEKKQHADILTIIAQSNGNATLMLENLLTRAADTNGNNWTDRFVDISYDDLLDQTGLAPSKAVKQLAKEYDDSAMLILQVWDAFRDELLNADTAKERLEKTDAEEIDKSTEVINNFELGNSDSEYLRDYAEATVNTENETELLTNRINDICNKEYLESIEYEDGTLYDFFTQEKETIEEDITVLYPLVAALSDGQKAGLEFVTLSTLVSIAGTKGSDYSDDLIDKLETVSIYEGVERAVYEKGGVALTSEAFRDKAKLLEASQSSSDFPFSWWTILSAGTALACAAAFFTSLGIRIYSNKQIPGLKAAIASSDARITAFNNNSRKFIADAVKKLDAKNTESTYTWAQYHKDCDQIRLDKEALEKTIQQENEATNESISRLSSRSSVCGKLAIGFGIAMIIIIGITIYFTYQDMLNRYKVAYTPIPKFMIDEKDLIGHNARGEKIVLKNQAAYYRAVLCNRANSAEYYKAVGIVADLNGDVGKQWLALYTESNENNNPILASSLKAVLNSTEIPAGYTTGIHMFGTDTAENLNNPLYVWNSSAPKVFVYFKTEDTSTSTAASNFSAGNLVLSGVIGMAAGIIVVMIGSKAVKRKKEEKTISA